MPDKLRGIENKIVLYYKFTPIADPIAIRMWQKSLCERLDLKGRIIISKDGINGTVGGSLKSVKLYIRETREYQPFKDIDFKWSEGRGDDFPRLRVRVRDEIVTFGVPEEIKVSTEGVLGGGTHLTPHQVNELVGERGDDVVFFDGRNSFEARIGRFRNAIVPDTETTPDFVRELESGKYDHLKNRPIITYCTGGIRCEVLSVIMKNRGFQEVYQIEGGIVRYAEQYRDKGLWEGSLYVFDERLRLEYGKNDKIIGECDYCDGPTHDFYNCETLTCRKRILVCATCIDEVGVPTCDECRENSHAMSSPQ